MNKFYVYGLFRGNEPTPFYIGKGKGNRMYKHMTTHSLQKPSHKNNIIKKALLDGVIITPKKLHENLTEKEALNIEMEQIAIFGRIDNNTGILVNHTNGGEGVSGYIVPEEVKKYKSIKYSGINNPNYGVRHSTQTKQLLSCIRQGDRNPFFNKTHSIETKKRQSEANSGSKNTFYNKTAWKHPKCTFDIHFHVWFIADELYNLYQESYGYRKMAKKFNKPDSYYVGLLNKFKIGWVPNLDNEWWDWKNEFSKKINMEII